MLQKNMVYLFKYLGILLYNLKLKKNGKFVLYVIFFRAYIMINIRPYKTTSVTTIETNREKWAWHIQLVDNNMVIFVTMVSGNDSSVKMGSLCIFQ